MKRLNAAVLFEVLFTSLALMACGQPTSAVPDNSLEQQSAALSSAKHPCPPKITITDLGTLGGTFSSAAQ